MTAAAADLPAAEIIACAHENVRSAPRKLCQVGDEIDYLHLHDTIHSDLSAPNILIDKNGRVLVTDFGLACQVQIEDYKNYMVGTPGYYSPEHISEASIVPQTDLYCAALILYELITGSKAVAPSTDRKEILKGMKNINLRNVVCADRSMQNAIRKILKSALHINPNRRTQSTEVMMYQVFSILKAYGIRYTRHAVKKFLIDVGLAQAPFDGKEQDIYRGAA